MSDQKDQPQTSPAQDSTGQMSKKRDYAETMSDKGSYDAFMLPAYKTMKLDHLQELAYLNVHCAFTAKSNELSTQGNSALQDLMREWKITQETHTDIDDQARADVLVKHLSGALLTSGEKEQLKVIAVEGVKRLALGVETQEKLDIAPMNIEEEKAKPSHTPDHSPAGSWGQVSPESLVGQRVGIRLLGEHTDISFLIKAYDPETETHRLASVLSREDFNDPCDWIDLRHIPAEDMTWEEEGPPGFPGLLSFPTRKCSLKPGETILHETSTARREEQTSDVFRKPFPVQ